MSGARSYHAGLAAEDIVLRAYEAAGHRLRARRWRGKAGEIDLILDGNEGLVIVEVKAAATIDAALQSLSHRQLARIARAAEEFLAMPDVPPLVAMRIDLAAVDGQGRVEIVPNITA
ncbi:YraN family protein [Palleronia sp. KMU-117]|uniref:YraN family protein n=1 Tax=Palleronia sp. KMU-117 TaxID=3434108 RepID=UPI003D754EA5